MEHAQSWVVRLPVHQVEATQPGFDGREPRGVAVGVESLGQGGPERRSQTGDVVRAVGGQAVFQLARQRVAAAQQVAEGVAQEAAAAAHHISV